MIEWIGYGLATWVFVSFVIAPAVGGFLRARYDAPDEG